MKIILYNQNYSQDQYFILKYILFPKGNIAVNTSTSLLQNSHLIYKCAHTFYVNSTFSLSTRLSKFIYFYK